MLEVIIRTYHFLYGKHISVVFTTRATGNILIKKCSIAVAKIAERRARRTYTDSTYTTQADCASIQRQGPSDNSSKSARVFSPCTISNRRLSRHSCEKREFGPWFRLTPANWQGTFVGKSDPAVKGENDGQKQRRRARDGAEPETEQK